MKLQSKFTPLIFTAFAMLSVVASASAQPKISPADLGQIQSLADTQGYAPITVSFNIDSSLSNLLVNAVEIEAQARKMENALLTSLGTNAIQSTVYRNGAGQSEIYVRKAALPLIDADPNVLSYWFNRMADTHRTTATSEDIDNILKQITATGYADVEAVLNIAHFDLGNASATTGVHKTHDALVNLSGQPSVLYEGCFGTNQSLFLVTEQSRCPNQNASGDTPMGATSVLGAGLPEYKAATAGGIPAAAHGTKVAGIAQGVAPNAWIASINISSDNIAYSCR